jgi:hypothetical protein
MPCRDCKHWGTEPYEYFDGEDYDEEKSAAHRQCMRLKLWDTMDGERPPNPSLPFLRDGSNYVAELWTPGEFACSLFEAKDPGS